MKTYEDDAIVLSGIRLGEADRILTLLTSERGKVKAVAKGVRKANSRFGGRLEPLNHVAVCLYQGKSLYTVTGASIIETFPRLRSEFDRTNIALACVEAAMRATHEGQPAPAQYVTLLEALRVLDEGAPAALFFAAYVLKLAKSCGFEFRLSSCVRCGNKEMMRHLSFVEGGVVCERCSHGTSCYNAGFDIVGSLAEVAEVELRDLVSGSVRDPARSGTTERLAVDARSATHAALRLFEYHLEGRLRSPEAGVSLVG